MLVNPQLPHFDFELLSSNVAACLITNDAPQLAQICY
jgi:hypothetical protein